MIGWMLVGLGVSGGGTDIDDTLLTGGKLTLVACGAGFCRVVDMIMQANGGIH